MARKGPSCHPYGIKVPVNSSVDGVDVALAAAVNCLDPEGVVVVLDSMLNKRMIELADARTLVNYSRFTHLDLASRLDGLSESGTETYVRLRLRALGIGLQIQVVISHIGRVDILVGTSLVIECDSNEHHLEKYQEDRTRDRMLVGLGFIVMRLTYEDIMWRWHEVLPDILAVIRRRDHLRPNATTHHNGVIDI